mmetsp:Transcript_4934/g.10884  ORF Transcript_4934/g.10884 Transcript_4934/m.10884 type:complete len:263 (-) Transcript_4934:60-848(-)
MAVYRPAGPVTLRSAQDNVQGVAMLPMRPPMQSMGSRQGSLAGMGGPRPQGYPPFPSPVAQSPAVSGVVPRPQGPSWQQPGSGGSLGELIASGAVDRNYVEAEAERKKQAIQRQLENQLRLLQERCQEHITSIQHQAEQQRTQASQEIEAQTRQQQQGLAQQAEAMIKQVAAQAEHDKGVIGQQAAWSIASKADREKRNIATEAARKAEESYAATHRNFTEQLTQIRQQIDSHAFNNLQDIERMSKQAVAQVYMSPNEARGP